VQPKIRRITNVYSGVAAVAAFVLEPIPALDELVIVPVHFGMCASVAAARGVKVKSLPWKSIRRLIWYGAAARFVANASIGLIPVVGNFTNALTAIALTNHIATYVDEAIEHPDELPPEITVESLKKMFLDIIQKQKDKGKSAPVTNGVAAAEAS
jgi:uncharacterized protein (DUF697 family)